MSARVGQQVLGGIRFAGVDGAPNRPWKYDKNNYQFRVGTAYSINEKTVFRAGYGKYFLNPTGQGVQRRVQPEHADLITLARRRPDADLRAVATRGRTGSRRRPAASLGPLTFLGRNPSFSNPDFIVPNVHQFSVGIQRELPWRISLEATYAGSRSYDIEGNFGGYQRAVGGVPGAVRRDAGREPQPSAISWSPNPFFNVAGFEGTTRFTSPTLSRFELARPFPAFSGCTSVQRPIASQNQHNLGKMTYDSLQFVANKRWAKGVTINASYTWVPRWTEDGANTTTGTATRTSTRSRCSRTTVRTSRTASTASPRRACGSCRGTATSAASRATSSAAGRSRRCSSTSPASRGTCPATSTWRPASTSTTSRCPARRTGSSSTA